VLDKYYDIVLYLGVHHHLLKRARESMMELVLSLGKNIAIRTNGKLKIITGSKNGAIVK